MYISLSDTFSIRNEAEASFLIKVDKIIDNENSNFGVFCIPPFIGYILSHIGDSEYSKSIINIADNLNISPTAVDFFVKQLINNKEKKEFKISSSTSIVLPNNLLISSETKRSSSVFEHPDFNGKNAFVTKRPNIPISVNLMVTTRCATDCMYCYANRNLKPILSTSKLIDIIRELRKQGTINLTLTGGDIFAHRGWHEILDCVRNCDYKPILSTKTPLKYYDIKFLSHLGYDEIQFSLDSVNPIVLEKLIRVNTEYLKKVETFLEYCSDLGLKVQIRSVLTKLNSSHKSIESQYQFLSRYSCVKEWDLTPAFFSPYKQSEYKYLEVDNHDLISVFKFSKREDLSFKVGLNKISNKGYRLKKFEDVDEFVRRNQICMANTTSLSILANGDCSVCEMLYDNPEYILGNVNNSSIIDIWNSEKALKLYSIKQEESPSDSKCRGCSVFENCRNKFGKRICYLDIAKSGKKKWYPDPRCPNAEDINLIL